MPENSIRSEAAEAKRQKKPARKKENNSHKGLGQIINRGKDTFLLRVYIGRDSQGRRHYYSETVKGSLKDAKKGSPRS